MFLTNETLQKNICPFYCAHFVSWLNRVSAPTENWIKMPRVGQISGTVQAPGELTFEWKIIDFFSLSDKRGDWYDSSAFNFADSQWHLELCPRTSVAMSGLPEGSASIFLIREGSGPPKTMQYWLGIKVPGGVQKKEEYERVFSSLSFSSEYLLSRSELRDRKSILMPNNVLTIMCCLSNSLSAVIDAPACTDQAVQATLDDNPSTDQAVSADQMVLNGEKSCLKSLLSLLQSAEDSDVIIKVQGKEFPAHRAVLRSRSAVFHSMFAHEMVEKNSGVVKIEDCDPTVFPDFLKHIYSGRCDHISSENVRDMYASADKYDFADLKQACSDFMKGHIDVGCFCDIITLAVKHSDSGLTECATKFFCDNSIDIGKTPEWQTFMVENPTVANELFLKAMSKFLNASKK